VRDLILAGQVLEAQDLLDLHRQRVAVVEHDLDLVADEHAPRALQLDHAIAIIITDLRVQRGAFDVEPGDGADEAHAEDLPRC